MIRACLALLAFAFPAAAQDFSAGSEAQSWNLYAEAPARFEATVVDPLCLFTGDCPADCGGGTRQLALLRSADDVLVMPLKNSQPLFTGAPIELLPFCGAAVEVDGLLLTDPDLALQNAYQVQMIRRQGEAEWTRAWYLRDPRILAAIAADGYLGLGPEADKAVLEEAQ
jgi:hypothetical protein